MSEVPHFANLETRAVSSCTRANGSNVGRATVSRASAESRELRGDRLPKLTSFRGQRFLVSEVQGLLDIEDTQRHRTLR